MSTVERVMSDSVRNSKLLFVKNKLSKKPREGAIALNDYLMRKRIIGDYSHYELRQNYSNDTVEFSKCVCDDCNEKYKKIAQVIIPATSGTDKYIKAAVQLQKSEQLLKNKKSKIEKFFESVCNFIDKCMDMSVR